MSKLKKECSNYGESKPISWDFAKAVAGNQADKNCIYCKGEGTVDSGGQNPDGSWIEMPCQCVLKNEKIRSSITAAYNAEYDDWYSEQQKIKLEEKTKDEQIKQLKTWINDLQSGMYINCVYCGHRYGPQSEVPESMADVLKEHIENCPKHPMSKLKEENERLKKQLEGYKK